MSEANVLEYDFRYVYPDVIAERISRQGEDGILFVGGRGADCILVRSEQTGVFLRTLAKVNLDQNSILWLSVWLRITEEVAAVVRAVWHEEEYAELSFEGHLANRLEPWGLAGEATVARVVDSGELPHCVGGLDPRFDALVTDTWEHDRTMGYYAAALGD